jgi:calcium-translocating P-type ATPase
MKIQQLATTEALRSLRSRPEGLNSAEARRRLDEFGLNRVEPDLGEPIYRRFLKEFTHFFALILWVAAAMAFWADWNDPGQGMGTLGWAVVGVIVINGSFSFWQLYGAEKELRALERLLPRRVKVLRDRSFVEREAVELVPGDVIALEAGDLVPADCRLIEAFAVRMDNAILTGESTPRGRDAEPCDEEDPLHCQNLVLAGTTMVSGDARALVFATGPHTEFGKIAHLTRTTGEVSFPLQREIARLSRLVAFLATTLGVVFFVIGWRLGLPFWANFVFAIGIIVANVPEGLLPTVTLALAIGSRRMAQRNVLIRHLAAVETLGSATIICTDKTGTLTENRMHAAAVFLGGTMHALDSAPLSELALIYAPFFEAALVCQNLKVSTGGSTPTYLGDPTEVALVEMARSALPAGSVFSRRDEIPFDSRRRRLSTVHETPTGRTLYTKGALEGLLPLCRQVRARDGVETLSASHRERLIQAQDEMASQGLRVLAMAYRPLDDDPPREQWERELILTGLVGLADPPRPEVPEAIDQCRRAGIKVIMVTGDHPQTALAVARRIGLVDTAEPVVLTGEQIHHMSNSQLQLALDAPEILFARASAEQKLRIVRALKRKGEIVAVTGDGVNDAPALKQADIGIAMGRIGTDVAREAADMVLTDDNFASIVAAIEEGRAVYDNIRKFLTYILTSNIPEIIPYLAFVLFRIPLPLTIIQILAVDLGTDMIPALGLGAERPEPGVMRRPPRPRTERLLTWPLLGRAYLFLGVLEATAAMSAFFFVLRGGCWRLGLALPSDDPLYLRGTTACLAAIIVTQVVNVFLCRSSTASVASSRLLGNRLILIGIAVELGLMGLIVYHPWGWRIFGTAPLAGRDWLFLVPFALGMLALEELRKWVVRRAAPGSGLEESRAPA